VRIAGRRPLLTTPYVPVRAWVAAGAIAVAAATVVVLDPLSLRGSGGRADHHRFALTQADTLGVGGLPSMTFNGDDGESLLDNAVVAYYGTPRQPNMGILGEHDAETLAWLLSARAARFDELNGDAGVKPVMHLVYGVAQPEAGADGLHLQYVDDRTVRQYLAVARKYGFALVIDLQIGHSTALAEAEKVLPYLAEPDVHLALDPEFALAGVAAPGARVGSLRAAEINAVQDLLAGVAAEGRLPRKTLIVHQFESFMLPDAGDIERRDDVDLVIDFDGYGRAEIKAVKYEWFSAAAHAPFGGIKVFLKHDPDVMTEQQLLDLEPRPAFFLYQ
jgi:hypothetical protein